MAYEITFKTEDNLQNGTLLTWIGSGGVMFVSLPKRWPRINAWKPVRNFNEFYDNEPYIHNIYIIGHYNPSIKFIDLVSHTTNVVCVNFIHKWRALQFKVNKFLEKLFIAISIYSQSICQKSAGRNIAKEILFILCFDVWPGALTLVFRLISQHTTY